MKSLKELEPFAWGYLHSDRPDIEYRIASGIRCRADFAPLYLAPGDTLAGIFSRGEQVGARYMFGEGIILNEEAFRAEKAENPSLSDEIDLLHAEIDKYNTNRLFQESKSDEEKRLTDGFVMWGGDWGGHGNPDYYLLLHLGTDGLRARNALYRRVNPGKDDFYDALDLALDALDRFGERIRERAETLAEKLSGEELRRMQRIARAFENIPQNPPRDFFEAVQFFWMASNFDGVDSPGRFDYTMGDYYELTPEPQRREILEALWELFHTTRTWNLCLGGSNEKGEYFANRLTYDILEVARRFRYNTPNLTLRVAPSMPEALWDSAVQTIATGIGMPSLYNDGVVCPALEALGIPPHDAHEYCMNGCNQIDIFGKSHMGLEDGEVNLGKCLELTLFNGVSPKHGVKMGLETGDASSFHTFDDLFDAYCRQVEYVTDIAVRLSNRAQENYAKNAPNPYRSNLIRGCAENGRDYKNGGPLYNHGQILAEGVADTVDSLSAIKHFVFDTETYSLTRMVSALRADFAGEEKMLADLSGYSKFGNDIPEVDGIARRVIGHFNEYLMTKRTYRGGIFGGGCSPFSRAAKNGGAVGALPNGKRRDSTLYADSIGATPGFDRKGPTALLNSVLAFDQRKAKSGFILNLKFDRSLFQSRTGQGAFIALAKAYFAGGGQNLSVSVVSAEDLRDAQRHPERHGDLIVRIGGYSDYFNHLPKELQENVIRRSELTV